MDSGHVNQFFSPSHLESYCKTDFSLYTVYIYIYMICVCGWSGYMVVTNLSCDMESPRIKCQ